MKKIMIQSTIALLLFVMTTTTNNNNNTLLFVNALDAADLELMFTKPKQQLLQGHKLDFNFEQDVVLASTTTDTIKIDHNRILQALDDDTNCYSTSPKGNNRYCVIDNLPRQGTFLVMACPTTRDDYSQCACEVGVGEPEQAPSTDTCLKCSFCKDQGLAYDCRNVAAGKCIGINCNGECISSESPEVELEPEINNDTSAAAPATGTNNNFVRTNQYSQLQAMASWLSLALLGTAILGL